MRFTSCSTKVATVAALVAVGAASAAGSAVAAARTHTLTFTEVGASSLAAGPDHIATELLKHNGHSVGEDLAYCVVAKSRARCNVAYAITGGLIYSRISAPASSVKGTVTHGSITGGTGNFVGVRGKVTLTRLTNSRIPVVLEYRN